jgi:hypothetical protein
MGLFFGICRQFAAKCSKALFKQRPIRASSREHISAAAWGRLPFLDVLIATRQLLKESLGHRAVLVSVAVCLTSAEADAVRNLSCLHGRLDGDRSPLCNLRFSRAEIGVPTAVEQFPSRRVWAVGAGHADDPTAGVSRPPESSLWAGLTRCSHGPRSSASPWSRPRLPS